MCIDRVGGRCQRIRSSLHLVESFESAEKRDDVIESNGSKVRIE